MLSEPLGGGSDDPLEFLRHSADVGLLFAVDAAEGTVRSQQR